MNMPKYLYNIVLVSIALFSCSAFVSCSDDKDEYGTEQYIGGISLNVYGPSPVARGGELRFLGCGLDQVTSIEIPGCDPITDIKVISSNEIRISVPQTAEVGLLTLNHANGKIVTKTQLTYTEPISIESFDPVTVKAGDQLTITGEYLNLIEEVIFASNVTVDKSDFISHSRSEIKVEVPLEAQTGKIIVSDGAEDMPNWIYSDEDLNVVLPSVNTPLDLTNAKPGDIITVTGKDFDLIVSVLMPNGDKVDFTIEDNTITFVLPDNVSDGAITVEAYSGVQVAIANIGVVIPKIESVTPQHDLRAGDMFAVKGVNMDQIVGVIFPNVDETVKPITTTPTEIKVLYPNMAQSGSVKFVLKSGKECESIVLTTAKPEVMGFNPNPVAAAAEFTMTGKNLDLVSKVTFGGGISVDVASSAPDILNVTAPATASSGALKLTMANGETVETKELKIDAPVCAYVTQLISEELLGGELLIAKIANADKLIGVNVNNQVVQYLVNGETLYVALPQTAGKNTTVTLVSSNGEISYTYDVIPATHVEIIAYNDGPRDLGKWTGEAAGGAFRIYKDVFDGIPSGAKLVFHISCYDFAQIQVNDANWTSFDLIQPSIDATRAEFELTAERLNHIITTKDGWSETALVIQGEGCIVNKVTIEYEISLETTIWEGNFACASWAGFDALAWGQYDWSKTAPGQILRIYVTSTTPAGDWWCVSVRHGENWGNLPDNAYSQIDMPADGLVEVVLSREIIDDLVKYNGMVITGQGYILNKVTLE